MLSQRGVFLFSVALAFLTLFSGAVSAIDAELSDSGTTGTVSVTSASNLYGYEIKMYYTGSVGSATFDGFLGDTTSGTYTRGDYVYVYESKTDGTSSGVTGSGDLFDLTHSGTLQLCRLIAVYGDGTDETVTHDCGPEDSGGGGGSSGGSSGGGGGSVSTGSALTLSANEVNVNAVYQKSKDTTIKLTNPGTTSLTLKVVVTGTLKDHISFPTTITLSPGETRDFTFTIDSSDRRISGTISFVTSSGAELGAVSVAVSVKSPNFLFDTSLAIADRFKQIAEGRKLSFQVNLLEVGVVNQQVDVVATYTVEDFAGNTYLEDSETFSVEHEKEFTKQLATQDLPPGKYVLELEVVYPGAFATSSTQFEVIPAQPVNWTLVGIAAGVGLLAVIVVIWAFRRPAGKLNVKRKK